MPEPADVLVLQQPPLTRKLPGSAYSSRLVLQLAPMGGHSTDRLPFPTTVTMPRPPLPNVHHLMLQVRRAQLAPGWRLQAVTADCCEVGTADWSLASLDRAVLSRLRSLQLGCLNGIGHAYVQDALHSATALTSLTLTSTREAHRSHPALQLDACVDQSAAVS